jgi:hypothetical protein
MTTFILSLIILHTHFATVKSKKKQMGYCFFLGTEHTKLWFMKVFFLDYPPLLTCCETEATKKDESYGAPLIFHTTGIYTGVTPLKLITA